MVVLRGAGGLDLVCVPGRRWGGHHVDVEYLQGKGLVWVEVGLSEELVSQGGAEEAASVRTWVGFRLGLALRCRHSRHTIPRMRSWCAEETA